MNLLGQKINLRYPTPDDIDSITKYAISMKLYLLPLLLCLILLSCATVPYNRNTQNKNQSIYGKWEWMESYLNADSSSYTYPNENYSKYIEITPEGNYNEYENNALTYSKKYTIQQRISIFDNQKYNTIIISGWLEQLVDFRFDKDYIIMELKDNDSSGYTSVYYKEIPEADPNIIEVYPLPINRLK